MDREELERLCEDNDVRIKKKLIDLMSVVDLFNMTPEDWLDEFAEFGKINKSTIADNRMMISKVYDLLVISGKIKYNPFYSPLLKVDYISNFINRDLYVSPEEIDSALNDATDIIVYECIIKLIYEGVKTVSDLYGIMLDDIDFKNKKIYFANYSINISNELADVISDYIGKSEYITNNNQGKPERAFKLENAYEGSLVKIIPHPNTTDKKKSFTNMCSRIFKSIGYNASQIYNSGFIYFLYKKCDFSIEELSKLFEKYDSPTLTKLYFDKLEGYAVEYGISRDAVFIKYSYYDYYKCLADRLSAD